MRRLQVTQAQIQGGDQLQELRQISDVKKWEMNQAADLPPGLDTTVS